MSERQRASALSELYNSEKTLSRSRHLELLVFSLVAIVESQCSDAQGDTDEYDEMRRLYKALAHKRRPDGSRY